MDCLEAFSDILEEISRLAHTQKETEVQTIQRLCRDITINDPGMTDWTRLHIQQLIPDPVFLHCPLLRLAEVWKFHLFFCPFLTTEQWTSMFSLYVHACNISFITQCFQTSLCLKHRVNIRCSEHMKSTFTHLSQILTISCVPGTMNI